MVSDSLNKSRRHTTGVLFQNQTDSTVTYELEKNNNSYSSVKITVNNDQKLNQTYTVYSHSTGQRANLKVTNVLYNGRKIDLVPNTNANDQDRLISLESNVFTKICTYCLETNSDEHLLLKLTTDTKNVFYLYRFGADGTKWRQLSLKELLNFSVISFEQMKNMENRLISEGLSNVMKEIISNNTSNTKALLDQINFEVNSCIVLLENLKGYSNQEITKLIGSDEIPSVDRENRIFVKESSDDSNDCIKNHDYKLYNQHLNELGKEKSKKDNKLFLRLYLFGRKISLYDSSNSNGKLTYINYNKNNIFLNVFFYDKDPRPMLLCYENKAYRPLNKGNYFNKWIQISDIGDCGCKANTATGSKLLSVLSEVVYIMNPVEINRGLDKDGDSSKYITECFNNNDEEINIKINYYAWDLNCYRGYKHELGQPGYILGEISYNGNKMFQNYEQYSKITGKNYVFPDKIMAYYYMYDGKHDHPLLIELDYEGDDMFSSTTAYYYKLTRKHPIKKWDRIDGSSGENDKIFITKVKNIRNEMNQQMEQMMETTNSEDYYQLGNEVPMTSSNNEQLINVLENKLDEIRNELMIEYTISEDNLIMSPNKCTKNNTGAIAGAVATIGLFGTGGGILIYKYQAIIVSYLRSLFN